MMRSQVQKILFVLFISAFYLGACTSAPENDIAGGSIDEEMMAETSDGAGDEVSDPSLDSSQADTSSDIAEEDLELDFDDFEKSEPGESQAQNEELSQDELAEELNLDDLQAEDVVQTPETAPVEKSEPIESEPFADELDLQAESEVIPTPEPTPVVEAPAQKTMITDIRYLANQAGGTVVIEGEGPLAHQSRFNPQNGQFVIEIENAILPEKLKRPYLMKDFSGSIGSVNSFQVPGEETVRVIVQLKPGFTTEPTLQVEGQSLVVVPPSAPIGIGNQVVAGGASGGGASQESAPLGAHNLEEFLMSNQKFFGKPISLQVRDADIRDVIGFVSEESGANIVISDSVTGAISLKIRKVPWDQALVSIMRTKNLGYVRQGNVIRISTMKDLREESETARDILLAQQELAPVKVKVIPLNYAIAEELEKQVRNFLSKDGKVAFDLRSNSLLVTDREEILEKISRLVAALDVQPNQVLIEGKIVEAVESFLSQVGVSWNVSGSPLTLSQTGGAFGTPLQLTPNMNFGKRSNALANVFGLQFGRLDFLGNLDAALQLAESEQNAKVISSPRVLAMNKEKAEIAQVGEQISITSTLDTQTKTITKSEKRTKVNLKLAVTPQITSDGSIIMDVDMTREFVGAVVDQDLKSAPVNTRTAKTKVLVRNGQTAVIGGVYQLDETQSESGVPVLKDIPILGWLFKTREKSRDRNELLIFLTPRVLTDSSEQSSASL